MRTLMTLAIWLLISNGVSLAVSVTDQPVEHQQQSLQPTTKQQKQKPTKKQKHKQKGQASAYSEEDILKIQKILRRYDYYDGPINGQLNDELKQAIRDFQDDENLPKTGELDEETYKRILSLQADESDEEPPR